MSRTSFGGTPTRRSSRLLKNGYYYNEGGDSMDEMTDETDGGGSVIIDSNEVPKRKVIYSKSSPNSRHKSRFRGARKMLNNSSSSEIPNHQIRVHKEVTRTFSQTRVNQTRVNHHTSDVQVMTSSVRHQQPSVHQVDHLFGLEVDTTNDDELVGRIYAGGESSRYSRLHHRRKSSQQDPPTMSVTPQQTITPSDNHHSSIASSKINPSMVRRGGGNTVYSDNEESNQNNKSSKLRKSQNLFDHQDTNKKKGKKNSSLPMLLLQTIYNFFTFFVSGFWHRGKLLYQTVASLLITDTWFLKTATSVQIHEESLPQKIFNSIYNLLRIITSICCAVILFTLLVVCVLSYTPHWSNGLVKPAHMVDNTWLFGDISNYISQFKPTSNPTHNTGGKETSHHHPSFHETSEYKHLIQTVRNLESSLQTLELKVVDQNINTKEIIENIIGKHQSTIKQIEQLNNKAQEDLVKRDAKFEKKVQNQFEETIQNLDEKIIKLQKQLNIVNLNSTISFGAINKKMNGQNNELKKEQEERIKRITNSQNEMENINTRLQLIEKELEKPKESEIDLIQFESLIEKRFIESFLLLLRCVNSPRHLNDEDTSKFNNLALILSHWLDSKGYLSKEDFENYASSNITAEIRNEIEIKMQQISMMKEQQKEVPKPSTFSVIANSILSGSNNVINEDDVKKWINEALETYSADRLGLADYALESAGGYIVNTRCTQSYNRQRALVKIFGIPLMYNTNTARAVIQPNTMPGECWAFQGHVGYLVVGLAVPIYPSSVTLEHIPRSLALFNISSAPKDFSVFGLNTPTEVEGTHLGDFRFEEERGPLQNFNIQNPDGKRQLFSFIEMRVTSNWGNPQFTCIYRFRVHGTKG